MLTHDTKKLDSISLFLCFIKSEQCFKTVFHFCLFWISCDRWQMVLWIFLLFGCYFSAFRGTTEKINRKHVIFYLPASAVAKDPCSSSSTFRKDWSTFGSVIVINFQLNRGIEPETPLREFLAPLFVSSGRDKDFIAFLSF